MSNNDLTLESSMIALDSSQIAQRHGAFLCPKILFGSTPETKKKWRAFIKKVWKTQNWNLANQLEMSDIRQSHSGIILQNADGYKWSTEKQRWNASRLLEKYLLTGQEIWHLNWTLEVQPIQPEDQKSLHSEHLHFVLSGLDHSWYALGMFGFWGLYAHQITRTDEPDNLAAILRKMAKSLHWLITLQDRLFYNVMGMMEPFKGNRVLHSFFSLLIIANIITQEKYKQVEQLTMDQTLSRLVEMNLLRFDGATFEAIF